jgi:NADH dehydrogenase
VSGVAAQRIGNLPETCLGRGRRIKVDAFNRVEGLDGVFCIGDQCLMEEGDPEWKGGHPQLAQVAIQQGRLLAKNLVRLEKGKDLKPFRYLNLGTMATVGRNRAVAEFSKIKMAGFFAWLMWLVVHLRSILGVRNKIIVLFNWMWNYFSYSQSLRLIVYARKAKEVRDRELRLADTHWGTDLMSEGADEIKLEGEK